MLLSFLYRICDDTFKATRPLRGRYYTAKKSLLTVKILIYIHTLFKNSHHWEFKHIDSPHQLYSAIQVYKYTMHTHTHAHSSNNHRQWWTSCSNVTLMKLSCAFKKHSGSFVDSLPSTSQWSPSGSSCCSGTRCSEIPWPALRSSFEGTREYVN